MKLAELHQLHAAALDAAAERLRGEGRRPESRRGTGLLRRRRFVTGRRPVWACEGARDAGVVACERGWSSPRAGFGGKRVAETGPKARARTPEAGM